MNIMRLEEKLRRDVPGGTNEFYKKWAEYIYEVAPQIVAPKLIEYETCSGCPADDLEIELEELKIRSPLELVPRFSA